MKRAEKRTISNKNKKKKKEKGKGTTKERSIRPSKARDD
jgi:hypothetical protein